jgi:hypothetical protein
MFCTSVEEAETLLSDIRTPASPPSISVTPVVPGLCYGFLFGDYQQLSGGQRQLIPRLNYELANRCRIPYSDIFVKTDLVMG